MTVVACYYCGLCCFLTDGRIYVYYGVLGAPWHTRESSTSVEEMARWAMRLTYWCSADHYLGAGGGGRGALAESGIKQFWYINLNSIEIYFFNEEEDCVLFC